MLFRSVQEEEGRPRADDDLESEPAAGLCGPQRFGKRAVTADPAQEHHEVAYEKEKDGAGQAEAADRGGDRPERVPDVFGYGIQTGAPF